MAHSTLRSTWGDRIEAARLAKGLSVNQLARLADIDPGGLSRIERGMQGVGDDTRLRIALALGKQVADLFPYPDTTDQETDPCPSVAAASDAAPSPTPATKAATPSPARHAAAQAASANEENPGNE